MKKYFCNLLRRCSVDYTPKGGEHNILGVELEKAAHWIQLHLKADYEQNALLRTDDIFNAFKQNINTSIIDQDVFIFLLGYVMERSKVNVKLVQRQKAVLGIQWSDPLIFGDDVRHKFIEDYFANKLELLVPVENKDFF